MARKVFSIALIALALGNSSVWAQLPVLGDYFAHDPSTMIKDGSRYYIFYTSVGIRCKYTTDLRNWSYGGIVFPSIPAWVTNAVPDFDGNYWAPDIAYFNGRYNLYYSVSSWGTIDSAIGLVTSPSLTSPTWNDQGKVIQSDALWEAGADTDLTSYNCIDPCVLVDTNGTVWLSFGSYSDGILVMQIDPTTGKRLNPGVAPTKIANNGAAFFSNTTEGSCIYQHGGYYYLFLNFGGCCSGIDSTYNIRVGRSSSVTGPYLDRDGNNMVNGGGTMLLESTGRFIGPGHAAIMNDNGTNWFTYHYYDGNNSGIATLGLTRLTWTDDDWPALTNDWSAFYTFEADAREHRGLYNGSLRDGATLTNETNRGESLALDGNSNYVTLPFPVANAGSFAAWVKWEGGDDWQRIFDFGSNTTRYLFLTPRASNGKLRFAIRNSGSEQQLDAPSALATGAWQHVAVTLDGARGVMYLNGEPTATNSISIRPWQTQARNNYLGKSTFANDPAFNGRIDSFRVFGRALSADEVRDIAWAQPMLAHRYSFTSDASDSIGGAHGKLLGSAVITNGALVLDGTSGDYLDLPGGLISGSSAVTVEFWATFGVNADWVRVFDFGNISGSSGVQYFFYSPHTSLGGQRMEMRTNVTLTMDIPGTLDNRTMHVVCIVDPPNNYAAVYTNGVLEQAMTASWPKLAAVNQSWSYLGRSLFSTDGWLNGSVDEFRIYDGRLTPEEIAVNDQYGPNALALPVKLVSSNSPAGLNLSWSSYDAGFVPETTATLNGGWNAVTSPPVLNGNDWQVTVPTTNAAQFYRLRR